MNNTTTASLKKGGGCFGGKSAYNKPRKKKGGGKIKRIAVITGASSGMGRRFAETVGEIGPIDELWVIARRADRLWLLLCHGG